MLGAAAALVDLSPVAAFFAGRPDSAAVGLVVLGAVAAAPGGGRLSDFCASSAASLRSEVHWHQLVNLFEKIER